MAGSNGQQQQTQAIQKAAPQTMSFKDYLEVRKPALAGVLPKHLTPERVVKVALVALNKTPKLRECSMESLFLAIMQAAELGLEPGGALGHAYLVPYKEKCTAIIGYRGMIELARRSGEIDSIEAHVVREKDKFTLRLGLSGVLDHEPFLDGEAGQLRFVYAIARLKGGGYQFEVMTKAQIDAIRGRSRAANDGPWVTDYEEMARKTVVRRLVKYLPMSTEKSEPLARALELDDESNAIDLVPADEAPPAKSRTDAVLKRVKGKAAEQVEDVVVEEPAAQAVTSTGEPPEDVKLPTPEGTVHEAAGGKVKITDTK